MIRKKTYVVTVNVPDECNFEDVLKSAFAYGWVLEVKEIPEVSDEDYKWSDNINNYQEEER